jgi:hypothetical protein
VLRIQGNLSEANTLLAIMDRFINSAPGNAGWQRDVAFSHGRVAIVLG